MKINNSLFGTVVFIGEIMGGEITYKLNNLALITQMIKYSK
jgi:hypothetical protein